MESAYAIIMTTFVVIGTLSVLFATLAVAYRVANFDWIADFMERDVAEEEARAWELCSMTHLALTCPVDYPEDMKEDLASFARAEYDAWVEAYEEEDALTRAFRLYVENLLQKEAHNAA